MHRAVVTFLLLPFPVWADHFTVELKIQAGKEAETIQGESEAVGVKPRPRKVMYVKTGTPLHVSWSLTNTSKDVVCKNVLVHFFAAREEKLGQFAPPKLDKKVPAETALVLDFNPGETARGGLTFTIDQPGFYLLRVETQRAAQGPEGHEHFAALDLVIEKKN